MGSSKKVTVGYHYRVLYHAGLCKGPIDSFIEFRGGDKTAWKGALVSGGGDPLVLELLTSGTINVNAPNLWGGEKDQGGITGDLEVIFGFEGQAPNEYLLSQLGDRVAAWRGIATVVFKGGRYGAINPYPQPASYKVRKIKRGWDDECWFPERAAVWPPDEKPLDPELICIRRADAELVFRTGGMKPTPEIPNTGVTLYSDISPEDSLQYRFVYGSPSVSQNDAFVFETNTDLGRSTYRVTTGPENVHSLKVNIITPDNSIRSFWPLSISAPGGTPEAVAAQWTVTNAAAAAPFAISGSTNYKLWYEAPAGYSGSIFDVAGNHDFSVYKVDKDLDCLEIYPDGPDMNPAHMLYYSRTNSDMGREPIESINDASLRAAARWFFDRGFGLSTMRDPSSESPAEFEQRISRVAGCAFTRSLADGMWYIDIANGEYDIDALPILTDDDILDFKEQPFTLDNAINSVSVTWFDRENKESVTTSPVRALGLIASFGTIHQTYDFPEITNAKLAMIVAMRELLATTTPTRAFDLVTNRTPYSWRANQYFRLQAPKRGIADMVCIVGEIQTGTLRSGGIKLKAAQDIYSLPDSVYVEAEPGVDTRPDQTPVAIVTQRVIEVPYIDVVAALSAPELDALDPDASFALAIAVDPAVSIDFSLRAAPEGDVVYIDVGTGEFCPTALVVEETDDLEATDFTLDDPIDLDQVTLGMAVLWDAELCRVDAIDVGAGTISLARGCADTVPSLHAADSRLWFYQAGAASDETEYTAGETMDFKLLTNTGSQQLPESEATTLPLTFGKRQALPYPPGALKLNGTAYLGTVSGALTITWAHRDRLAQADQLIDTTAASIGPEPDTRYTLAFYDATDALIIEREDIGPPTADVVLDYTGDVTLRLWSVSEAGRSIQEHVWTFDYTPPGGASSITATDYEPYIPTWEIDGNGG